MKGIGKDNENEALPMFNLLSPLFISSVHSFTDNIVEAEFSITMLAYPVRSVLRYVSTQFHFSLSSHCLIVVSV